MHNVVRQKLRTFRLPAALRVPLCWGLSAASIPVTAVAISAVVNVSADTAVIGISLRFLMAVGTGKDKIIAGIGMARRANATGSAMIGWEPGVIEGCSQPTAGGVARGAGGWEAG